MEALATIVETSGTTNEVEALVSAPETVSTETAK